MIGNNPFRFEVSEISKKGSIALCNYVEAQIELGSKVIRATNVKGMIRYRDYIEDYAQQFTVTLTTTLAQYEQIIHSDLSNIKITLTMFDLPVNAPFSYSILRNPKEFTYKAKILNIDSSQISQNNTMINNPDVGNLTFKEFSVQLLEPSFESVSIKTVGGPFRKTNGIELIKTLLTKWSTEDEIDAITSVKGVDVVDGYNEAIREQIIIDHTTPLVKAIQLINESCGGVYPTGFSFFLQNQLWYIFPPYDLTRFNKTNRTITVVNLPKDRLPGIEKTFFNSQTKLIVLSTRNAKYIDNREANTFNKGSSFRFVEANRLYEGFGQVQDNKFMVNAGNNVNEVTIGQRSDNANILRSTDVKITSNKNNELSKLAMNNGFYFQLTWEHSDDSLLHPGMPAKVLFLKNNQPASVTGTLIESETQWVPIEQNFKYVKLQRMTAMTFFVGNEEYLNS